MIANTSFLSLPFDPLELLTARESLLKRTPPPARSQKHIDTGHDAQFDEHAGKLFTQH
jgi:hypothetical protein